MKTAAESLNHFVPSQDNRPCSQIAYTVPEETNNPQIPFPPFSFEEKLS